jgi:thioredoxin reductase (NADPH)
MSDPEAQQFDVVVVGAGIAGLSAATTAAGLGLSVVVLEQLGPGGQLLDSSTVQDDELGEQPAADLAAAAMERAMDAGAVLEFTNASKLVPGERHLVETDAGTYSGAAVVLAMGSTPSRVEIPGEVEFAGRGVSYCVACDGPLFSGKPVVLLGAGRYAAKEAQELREFVSQITVISLDDSDAEGSRGADRGRRLAQRRPSGSLRGRGRPCALTATNQQRRCRRCDRCQLDCDTF